MSKLDKRLNAFRPDLADRKLKAIVDAERFSDPTAMQIATPIANVHLRQDASSMQVTQALMGEQVRAFDCKNGWTWVQLADDGYVGYIRQDLLSETLLPATHHVIVASTVLYPKPDLKTQPTQLLTLNARVHVVGQDGDYSELASGGFVLSSHLWPVGKVLDDYVSVAERFLNAPYLWGGKSVLGIDCSGLVQLALQACGIVCLRDSDMQEEAVGTQIMKGRHGVFRRGDLVFWDGHVGIMRDPENLLHASGRFMIVESEKLDTAIARIGETGKPVTAVRRIEGLYA